MKLGIGAMNSLRLAVPIFFALGLMPFATLPAVAAPSACDGLEQRDQARCLKAERDDPQWRTLRDQTCKPTEEAKNYLWAARFVEMCRRIFADALPSQKGTVHWQARVDRYFRDVAIATVPSTDLGGQKLPAELHQRLQASADRWIAAQFTPATNDAPDISQDTPLTNYTSGSFVSWVTPSLASIGYSEWSYSEGMPHGRYFQRYEVLDRKANRSIADLSELFTNPAKVVDIVSAAISEQIADQDIDQKSVDELRPHVTEMKRWSFNPKSFQIFFSPYDLGGYIPAHTKPIPYSVILPYIKKDGPLGRSLKLK